VDGEIDLPVDQRPLQFLGEEPLAADVVQWAVGDGVAGGLDDDQLDREAGMSFFECVGHELALHSGEEASARAEAEGRCWSIRRGVGSRHRG